jgi:cyclase
LKLGVEKVSINSAALDDSNLIREASTKFGSQSIVVSIDIKKQFFGKYKVYSKRSKKNTGLNPIEYAKMMEDEGAGELFINNIDRDGTLEGYDLELISEISSSVGIPIIACGGAANVNDFLNAVNAGASAVAAGSMFVFKGSRNSVLINFPTENELFQNLYNKLI